MWVEWVSGMWAPFTIYGNYEPGLLFADGRSKWKRYRFGEVGPCGWNDVWITNCLKASPKGKVNKEIKSHNYHIYFFLIKKLPPKEEIFEKVLYIFSIWRSIFTSPGKILDYHICLLFTKNHSPKRNVFEKVYILYVFQCIL